MPTVRTGVVGHPIVHSLSPAIHTAALHEAGIDASYEAFDVLPEEFAGFVEKARVDGVRGLNVTVPHKTAAFAFAEERSEEADATGAVNTLLLGDRIAGHNTDVAGLRSALEELDAALPGTRALVLGAGGAGRAATWTLQQGGAEVIVANRTRAKAVALGTAIVSWEEFPDVLTDVDLLVQTTSVGLSEGTSPVSEADLGRAAAGRLGTVLDVVYRPGETQLVRLARSVGLRTADGLSMLVHQAAEAFRLFFEVPAPVEAMRRAAYQASERPERAS